MLFRSRVRVKVRIRIRFRFSVLLVRGYAHVFVLLSVVIVTLPGRGERGLPLGPAHTGTQR